MYTLSAKSDKGFNNGKQKINSDVFVCAYLLVAFPFWGTFLNDNIDIDSYGVDLLDNSDYPGTNRLGFSGPNAWRTIYNL